LTLAGTDARLPNHASLRPPGVLCHNESLPNFFAGITPGFANIDLRLTRTVTLKEKYRIQGFVEVFNLFNRVNISEIDRTFPPDANGNFNLPKKDGSRFTAPPERFRNAFAPRQIQLGFRLNF